MRKSATRRATPASAGSVTVGELSESASRAFGLGARHYASQHGADRGLAADAWACHCGRRALLVKGSRGSRMDRVVKALLLDRLAGGQPPCCLNWRAGCEGFARVLCAVQLHHLARDPRRADRARAVAAGSGPAMIRKLATLKGGQPIRTDGPQSHFSKAGTPTMGGALILLAVAASRPCCGRTCATATSGSCWRAGGLRRDRLARRLDQDRASAIPNGLRRAGQVRCCSPCSAWPPACCCTPPPTCRPRPRCTCPSSRPSRLPLGHRLHRRRLLLDRRLLQRGQPDRWPRRPGDHADGAGGGALGIFAYASGNAVFAEVPADPAHSRCRRADHLLRSDRRRGPGLPLVQHLSGDGVHGRHRRAGARRGARHHRRDRAPGSWCW
jgi:hypothetical protein